MADGTEVKEIQEEIKEQEIKEEVKEDISIKKEEVKEEVKDDKGMDGPSPGILDKIKNIFVGKKEEVKVEKQEEIKSEVKEEDFEYEEIDSNFVDVARKYGWTDKRIIEYAESHPDIDVMTMADLMASKVSQDVPKKDEPKKGFYDEETLAKLAEEDETLAALLDKAVRPLAKRLAEQDSELEGLKGGLQTREQERKLKEDVRRMEIADEIFDAAGIDALGKTDAIPKYPDGSYEMNNSIVQERQKVWEVAQLFHAKGGSFKSAMENAVRWYKGSSAEGDMEKKVIGKLKEQEKRVFPKRTNQKVTKTYASEEERKADIINEALAKYDKQLPM